MSTATKTAPADGDLLLRILEEGYRRSTWNDTNLLKAIKGVGPSEAAWRPEHGRHNIAEIVLHCAYWKYMVRRRLLGDRRRTFPLKGSDWFEVEAPMTEARWTECVKLLDDHHENLLAAAKQAGRARAEQVYGIAMHDAYHTGQVHLIRAMYGRHVGQ